jgi:DMSO/TMAO reductase YedYZ molybdopterin-dependent catalytic subunit
VNSESGGDDRLNPTAARTMAIGVAAVAAALGAQELVAGVTTVLPSLMEGAASWVIDVAPADLVEWAISTLDAWTKRSLIIGIAVVLLLAGVLTSFLPTTGRRAVFAIVGVVGALVTATGTAGLLGSLVSAAVAVTVGITADARLRRTSATVPHDASRRTFVTAVATMSALAVAAAAGGRYLIDQTRRRLARRDDVVLPDSIEPVEPVAAANEFDVEGLEPVVTPNDRFFRVDIGALGVPEVDLSTWTLTVSGMVERELTLDYGDLLEMDLVERYVTLACVSNKVGGRLVGNAAWLGVPFSQILEMAGVTPAAEQVAARGVDGFSTGFPLAAVYDRDTLLAIGMNGEPLPYTNGFPARLVVPGYFGFVSAAKWVEHIDVTTWDDHDSYWVRLGWAKHAPVETQSRIDAPRDRMSFPAGQRMIAGVAWAPFLGISRVEVRVDDGPWIDAELSEPLGAATWVQWRTPWDASPGEHTISVRATDGDGVTQTATERRPVPSGATGHHTIQVRAE